MQQPNFWQNPEQAKTQSQKAEILKSVIADWDSLSSAVQTNIYLLEQSTSNDVEMVQVLTDELGTLTQRFAKLEFLVLFSQPYDSHNTIISLHAGAGGVEAQDWVAMLFKMYSAFCTQKGFAMRMVDQSRGQQAGYKSLTMEITGPYAYGTLKSEAGVHRLVRISPFDAEQMRHTSFALAEVLPVLEDSEEITIADEDLKIDTMKAGGHGGQSVNTTDSAVRITHLPSGLVVKSQNERSQLQNKKTAMKLLQSKLAKLAELAKQKELAGIRGEQVSAEWGSQIRSYVLQPYKLVKDHRTGFESTEPDKVLAGGLDGFVENYLRYLNSQERRS